MDYRSTTITVNDSEVTTSRNWQQLNHIKQTQFVRKKCLQFPVQDTAV